MTWAGMAVSDLRISLSSERCHIRSLSRQFGLTGLRGIMIGMILILKDGRWSGNNTGEMGWREELLETKPPLQTESTGCGDMKTWTDHCLQVADKHLWPVSPHEVIWYHGLDSARLQRSRTDGPPHPPRQFPFTPAETATMRQPQASCGNSGRPALRQTAFGSLWVTGLSIAAGTAEEERAVEEMVQRRCRADTEKRWHKNGNDRKQES